MKLQKSCSSAFVSSALSGDSNHSLVHMFPVRTGKLLATGVLNLQETRRGLTPGNQCAVDNLTWLETKGPDQSRNWFCVTGCFVQFSVTSARRGKSIL